MPVVAAFYPLQFAAEQVGGDRVSVTSLTAAGAEPHDLELTPQALGEQVAALAVKGAEQILRKEVNAGVHADHGEIAVQVGARHRAALRAAVSERDGHLVAAQVVGVREDESLTDHDPGPAFDWDRVIDGARAELRLPALARDR